jgi:hypothetical protein
MSKRQRTELSGPSELEKRLTNANSELQAENDDLKGKVEGKQTLESIFAHHV